MNLLKHFSVAQVSNLPYRRFPTSSRLHQLQRDGYGKCLQIGNLRHSRLETCATGQAKTGSRQSAFTMIEIAISMGIIAIALVAIIGILPKGLNTQKENRDDTLINQDGPFLLEAIRSGAQGLDHLTNYFEWIRVSNSLGAVSVYFDGRVLPPPTLPSGNQVPGLLDGQSIIGLLSTPRIVGLPTRLSTNYVTAYVRSLSGAAVEQGKASRDFSFGYLLTAEVLSVPNIHVPFDDPGRSNEVRQLTNSVPGMGMYANFHDIRLTFQWPVKPNLEVPQGANRKVFRTVVAGSYKNDDPLFFIQPQRFDPVP